MKILSSRKFQAASIALLLMLFIAYNLIENKPAPPSQIGHWEEPMDLFICDTLDLPEEDLRVVLSWWEDRGYEFGEILAGYPCTYNYDEGYDNIYLYHTVILYPPYKKIKVGDMGRASVIHNESSEEILSAVIELYSVEERVIVHEIGHTLGWQHTDIIDHIMYHDYNSNGWNDLGIIK
jgi:hypothetical protein